MHQESIFDVWEYVMNKHRLKELRGKAIPLYALVGNLEYLNVPLWAVYGYDCFPSIWHFILSSDPEGGDIPIAWGFSVYKNSAGYRTNGRPLVDCFENHWSENVYVFGTREDFIAYVDELMNPSTKKD